MTRAGLFVIVAAALAAAAAGCKDPVHDDAVSALPPEDPSVPPGPLHRPGQPCLVCHDGGGPGSLVFGTAGTIFQDQTDLTPLVAATVQLSDATVCAAGQTCNAGACVSSSSGVTSCSETQPCPSPQICEPDGCHDPCPVVTSLVTNCAGNFWVEAVDWNPVFPVHVQVLYGDMSAQMLTHMGRSTSCATCHTGTETAMSTDHIYLNPDPMTYPPSGCP